MKTSAAKGRGKSTKGPALTRPLKAGVGMLAVSGHRKISQAEHENVGTQAAHRAEMTAEGGLRSLYRHHKTAHFRGVQRLERKSVKLKKKTAYKQSLLGEPGLKRIPPGRAAQKRLISRQYAKAARKGEKIAQGMKKAGDVLGKTVQAAVKAAARHPAVIGTLAGLFLLVVVCSSAFTSCMSIVSGVGSSILSASYLAEDGEIDKAELFYTELETDLLLEIDGIEEEYPNFDEYNYQIDDIGHNPYELMAFLTTVYGEFVYADIEDALRQLFDDQYSLETTETTEQRQRSVTVVDPETGASYEMIETYEWHILNIKLTSKPFREVIFALMDEEQQEHYNILMQTKGGRQYIGSPFDFPWIHSVSSYYGYRIHPISGEKDYHKGVDIAVPVGTAIHAGLSGKVTLVDYFEDYGNVVVIEDNSGLSAKYAHCDSISVSVGQEVGRGDVIALSGNSGRSTGPHLHFEIIKNGVYLNPIYFSETRDASLYEPQYGTPPEAMGDGSYAALIEEAERHLGKPYVFGSSGPNTFDCSGFIYYVYNRAGVADFGRTTAQGIYNMSTPVSAEDVRPGDLVFFHSTYSTANTVTHLGIYVGNGRMLHAGSPVQYASFETNYWRSHFYAFARLN